MASARIGAAKMSQWLLNAMEVETCARASVNHRGSRSQWLLNAMEVETYQPGNWSDA